MGGQSNPTIEDAKQLVKRDNLDGAIIFFFRDSKYGYAEYGKDRALCAAMKQIADQVYEEIQTGQIHVEAIIHEAQMYTD